MSRAKGLIACHEVKAILIAEGHQVDGPYFKPIWFGGKTNVVHKDIFDCADLLSFFNGRFHLHQVSDVSHKSEKVKTIQEKGIPCWIWGRTKEGNKVMYRVWVCINGKVLEDTPRWKGSHADGAKDKR